jgi:hypothetical protein
VLSLDVLGAIGAQGLVRQWGMHAPVHLVNSPFRNNLASKMRVWVLLGNDSFSAGEPQDLDRLVHRILDDVDHQRQARSRPPYP